MTEKLAFVVPMVDPDHKSVEDYRMVESLLRNTLRSILSQTNPNVSAVVCCHRVPEWAAQLEGRVHFLNLADNIPIPSLRLLRVDKGRKYILGSLYAARTFNPTMIMPADADDLVHTGLTAHVLASPPRRSSADGYVIKHGVEATIRHEPNGRLTFEYAVRVSDFDKGCGTCRIFIADRLLGPIRSRYTDTAAALDRWDLDHAGPIVSVPADLVRVLVADTEHDAGDQTQLVDVIGRHAKQAPFFDLEPIDRALAAKTCGHANHAGRNGGHVHWNRYIETVPMRRFLAEFGLPDATTVRNPQLSLLATRLTNPQAGMAWLRRSKIADYGRKLMRDVRRPSYKSTSPRTRSR